jgi:hypothetical protein
LPLNLRVGVQIGTGVDHLNVSKAGRSQTAPVFG